MSEVLAELRRQLQDAIDDYHHMNRHGSPVDADVHWEHRVIPLQEQVHRIERKLGR